MQTKTRRQSIQRLTTIARVYHISGWLCTPRLHHDTETWSNVKTDAISYIEWIKMNASTNENAMITTPSDYHRKGLSKSA